MSNRSEFKTIEDHVSEINKCTDLICAIDAKLSQATPNLISVIINQGACHDRTKNPPQHQSKSGSRE